VSRVPPSFICTRRIEHAWSRAAFAAHQQLHVAALSAMQPALCESSAMRCCVTSFCAAPLQCSRLRNCHVECRLWRRRCGGRLVRAAAGITHGQCSTHRWQGQKTHLHDHLQPVHRRGGCPADRSRDACMPMVRNWSERQPYRIIVVSASLCTKMLSSCKVHGGATMPQDNFK